MHALCPSSVDLHAERPFRAVQTHWTSMSDKTKVQELAERKRKEFEERRAAEQTAKRQKQLAGVGTG